MTDAPRHQKPDNLIGEVRFRSFHKDSYDAVLDYLRQAVAGRTGKFADLLLRDLPLTPFVEIGCETGINGLILVNRLGQRGICADISLDALKAMDAYREKLGFTELPLRVCCDANRLPIRSGSLRFALAWGTLHHFPDPRVPLKELRRALRRGGLCTVDEEPVKRLASLNLSLTKSPERMNAFERALLRLRVLPLLFAIDGAEAADEGALEMKFSAWEWKRFLPEVFEEVRFHWHPLLTGDMASVSRPARFLLDTVFGTARAEKIATALGGGLVGATAFKRPERKALALPSPESIFRVVIRKPAGNDTLVVRFDGDASAIPRLRLGTTAEPVAATAAGDGSYTYHLPAQAAEAGVLDLEFDSAAGRSPVSLSTDGPAGRAAAPVLDDAEPERVDDPAALLTCPSCAEDEPALETENDALRCTACGTEYPVVDGIPILIEPGLRDRLGYA